MYLCVISARDKQCAATLVTAKLIHTSAESKNEIRWCIVARPTPFVGLWASWYWYTR